MTTTALPRVKYTSYERAAALNLIQFSKKDISSPKPCLSSIAIKIRAEWEKLKLGDDLPFIAIKPRVITREEKPTRKHTRPFIICWDNTPTSFFHLGKIVIEYVNKEASESTNKRFKKK